MTSAPTQVVELVERFERNLQAYRSDAYNEARLRREFIDPLFRALGWDVANEAGAAEVYKEVIHEDSIRVGGATKAPDYCFLASGRRKFFVEAKKPAVNIRQDPGPAFQLRRYAWSSDMPLSVLTNFEELALYNCRIRPSHRDNPSKGRLLLLSFRDYVPRWSELSGVLSREAVVKGLFDTYLSRRGTKGTAPVDSEFLDEIESWRDLLARNIALRNTGLDDAEVNFAVQRTIDRIVFLRICEDRGIETYAQLQELADSEGIYRQLGVLFKEADEKYNSGLFHFYPDPGRQEATDDLTLRLRVDDRVLRGIVRNLYYPDSPYEFSVLPADILGQVYEQFLGKVIRLTPGRQAKVEPKPEVRKAGGVYYTPTFVVDFIVDQTVGTLLRDRTIKEAARLRIVDPACGSGSFLLGAYQYLLNWHREQYERDGPEKHKRELYQGAGGGWRLTATERRRILLNSIYGVDIDPQAVEVTKLSLLLKVLEGETEQSLTAQLRMFHERALPDLGRNIKCGNSLVGSDFEQLNSFTVEDLHRINPFDWSGKDGFPTIMRDGGFHAVIGNPPYVRQELLAELKSYFTSHYRSHENTADLYVDFMEKALDLLRPGGLFSFIVSASFLRTTYAAALRRHIRQTAAVLRIVDFGGLSLFAKAKDVYVCIPLFTKGPQPDHVCITKVRTIEALDLREHVPRHSYQIPASRLTEQSWPVDDERTWAVFQKIKAQGTPLGSYLKGGLFYGVKTGLNKAFELDPHQRTRITSEGRNCSDLIKPFYGGQNIRRYYAEEMGRFLVVIPSGWTRERIGKGVVSEREAWNWFKRSYAPLAHQLEPHVNELKKRQDQGEFWWELRPCDYYHVFDRDKIVFPDIAKGPRFHLDTSGTYISNTAYCLATDDLFLLGLLNSSLFWFAISRLSIPFGTRAGRFRYRLIYQYMEHVPIRAANEKSPDERRCRERIVTLVERMIASKRQLLGARPGDPHTRTLLERQIDAADREIDDRLFALYGLNQDEIDLIRADTSDLVADDCPDQE